MSNKMTQSVEEWINSTDCNVDSYMNPYDAARLSYKAGAASRQAEIDALQKRIDDLKKMAFNLKTDLIRENHVEYDKGWKDCATSFYHEILKGESE